LKRDDKELQEVDVDATLKKLSVEHNKFVERNPDWLGRVNTHSYRWLPEHNSALGIGGLLASARRLATARAALE